MSTSDNDFKKKKKTQYEEARTVRKIVFTVLTIAVIVIAAIGFSGYFYVKSALQPVDPSSDQTKKVEIPLGSTVSTIASTLEEADIIKNDTIFRYYVKFKNEHDFQAGEYELSPSMTLDEIIDNLKTGTVQKDPVITVTIPEGKTVEEIANIYSKRSSVSEKEFLEKVNDKEFVKDLINAYPVILSDAILKEGIKAPLEGYLFAATYNFYTKDPSVDQIVHKMLDKTREVVVQYMDQFEAHNLTVHEAITMASLVENEATSFEDRQKIAGVFYNRMDEGMPLQTDPTVLYALGEHKEKVTYDYLEIDSPYNTYMYADLPIGPISNFAGNSLEAVVKPVESDWLYFLAATDSGKIHYSKTLEEHNRKKAQYID
ncbi:endolytic transglycosylase MltG [Virgibacillus sp. MSP4-1]|uniref:endolytic transglycosylase MltG n=1 Tax=Virgibacillus sp. MSP4-1 TaxID=2700081 RepID=UPI0003A7FBF4|nr:endolytic transglycosylase MltG [Virgibacillus sp. MSP4-1]QHS22850.1 endolytic transglycosylase MltG [Virgibacillus sp. MSP4-1]